MIVLLLLAVGVLLAVHLYYLYGCKYLLKLIEYKKSKCDLMDSNTLNHVETTIGSLRSLLEVVKVLNNAILAVVAILFALVLVSKSVFYLYPGEKAHGSNYIGGEFVENTPGWVFSGWSSYSVWKSKTTLEVEGTVVTYELPAGDEFTDLARTYITQENMEKKLLIPYVLDGLSNDKNLVDTTEKGVVIDSVFVTN